MPGSGEIFIRIQVHLDLDTLTETFSWVVLGGTGDYAEVHGSGKGSTFSEDPRPGNVNMLQRVPDRLRLASAGVRLAAVR